MQRWRSNGGVLTHTLMNGGSLSVPKCDSNDFFKTMVECMTKKEKLYVVELKTPKFKMFMDVDYVGETELSRDEIVDIIHKIHQVIPGRCVSAIAKPKKKDSLIKSGIHIHWPDLTVTKSRAIELMNDVLATDEPFTKFIDDSVYKGSGLRMLWCYKKGRCGDEGPYEPFYDASAQKFFVNTHVPKFSLLKLFSIRVESSVDEDLKVLNVPEEDLERFIHTCVDTERRMKGIREDADTTKITKITRQNNHVFIQTMSKFCLNKKQCHKSNHVYYVVEVDKKEFYQRCFDDECKKYQGTRHRVPMRIMDRIVQEAPPQVEFLSLEDAFFPPS